MRRVRLTLDRTIGADGVDRKPPTATALTFGEILIDLQIIPACRECRPVRQRTRRFQHFPHRGRAHERVSGVREEPLE